MSLSLKRIAENCLSLHPPFSVIRDVFGYMWRDNSGNIFYGYRKTMSLKRQLQLIKGASLDISIIRVGRENFTEEDNGKIQYGVQIARDIFAQVNLGIRRIYWSYLTVAEAGGYYTIDSYWEALGLTEDWNGPGYALDVFVVRTISGHLGWSAPGPCTKDIKVIITGTVVSLDTFPDIFGIAFAHEIGHYLGLILHDPDPNNFMHEEIGFTSTQIRGVQGDIMKLHCYVTTC